MSTRLRTRLLFSHLLLTGLALAGMLSVIFLFVNNPSLLAVNWATGVVLGTLALLLFASWLAWRLAQTISLPLERIAAAAREVAARRFDVLIRPSSLTEANTLAASFNEMTAELARYELLNIDRLLAQQRRLETVLSSIDDGLVMLDEHGCVEGINTIASRQLGIQGEEALGHSLDHLLGGQRFDARIRSCIATQSCGAGLEPDLVLGEGPYRRVLTYSLVPFDDGLRPGLVMVLRDVTEERAFDRMRNEFVLRASHELRTPVTALRMALDLLAELLHLEPGTRTAELLDMLQQETRRLIALLNGLLDLSRIDGPPGELNLARVDLASLIEDSINRFQAQAIQAGITLCAALVPSSLPPLLIDRSLFSRVLDNLIGNALRYTPTGGEIRLAASALGDTVEVTIADTGPGVPASIRKRLFEPFVRGDAGGGAGLGLTLCREIVSRHGGRIELDQSTAAGARFVIRLPILAEDL